MMRWTIVFKDDEGRESPLTLRGTASAGELWEEETALCFAIPDGRHVYLSSKPSTNFAEPPADDPLGLRADALYGLSARVTLDGGEGRLSLIGYDDRRSIDSIQRPLSTGAFSLSWSTPPAYRSSCLAVRLAGAGRLEFGDLRLRSLSDPNEPRWGDALLRVPADGLGAAFASRESAEEVAVRCRARGLGRVLLVPEDRSWTTDAFDQVSAAGMDERSGCHAILPHRPAVETRAKYRTFEVNQLELLWQLGRMGGLLLDATRRDDPGDHVLKWLDLRGLPTLWRIGGAEDIAWLEERVWNALSFPSLVFLKDAASATPATFAALRSALERRPFVYVLSGPGWDAATLRGFLDDFPQRVLFASHDSIADEATATVNDEWPSLDLPGATRTLFLGGNLRRLMHAARGARWEALHAAAGLRFPAVPRTPAEVERQGFEVIPPDAMPPAEFAEAKDFWADYGVRDFYKNYKPWASLLIEAVRDLRPSSVLEFGCNVGRNLYALAEALPGVPLTGIDLNRGAVEWGREQTGLDLRYGDENGLAEFEEGAFDLVFTVSVLDHIADVREVCRQLMRVARRHVLLLEVTLPVDGKVLRHFDHALGAVRESTGASYSWHVAEFLRNEPRLARLDCRPCYMHDGSLGPYYWRYLAHVKR